MKKNIVIKLDNVWKIYKMGDVEVPALQGLNLTIREDEFVAIMGPSGSGKCVSGDSELVLSNGLPIKIKDIKNKKNIRILALDKKTGKIKSFPISKFYKRRVKSFLEIKTSSGKTITATKEHPFFTLDENGFSEILAKDLQKGTFIATARRICTEGEIQHLNPLNHLSGDDSLIISDSTPLVKGAFEELSISKKDICERFNFNYSTCDSWTYKNNISLNNFKKILEDYGKNIADYGKEIKLTALSSNKKVKIPINTSHELLELYGFLVGDGNIDKDGIKITNIDKNVKDRVKYLFKNVFGFETKEFVSKRIDANSKVLVSFFSYIFEFPLVKKSRNIKLPEFIFKCSNKEISSFIRGLFDCDAHVAKNKKEIVIILASKNLIKQLVYLLLRFGIVARYSERIKCAVNTKAKIKREYYSLSISGLNNLQLYKEYIGFNSEFKRNRLNKQLLGDSNTNVDVIPCGNLIRKLRRDSGILLSRKIHDLLWPYESGKINPSVKKLKDIIRIFGSNRINVKKLKDLINKDIFWDKIIYIKKSNKEIYVYDITVPRADNFVANGFIIHNSTAMNMIGCLDVPTMGEIYLDNQNIAHLSESDLAQIRGRRIGFIFQTFNLIQTLTALENVTLPMVFQNKPREERIKRATELLKMVDLGDRLRHKPTELSGGQQQRVAIARALSNDPEVILADEPTGNLDSVTGHKFMDFLQDFNKKQGKTIIVVTHDKLVASHAQRTELLKDGKIIKTIKR